MEVVSKNLCQPDTNKMVVLISGFLLYVKFGKSLSLVLVKFGDFAQLDGKRVFLGQKNLTSGSAKAHTFPKMELSVSQTP